MKIYIDGQLLEKESAKISVFDHGLLYGDGVFEGIRVYNGRIFKFEEHLRRLYDSAKSILLEIPLSIEEMSKATKETCQANEIKDGYIRLVITRGVGNLGLNPYQCPKASVIIIAAGIQLYPADKYINGLILATCSTRRPKQDSLSPQVKSLNYLSNIMARIEAMNAGADEGLMLNDQGLVAECTGDNVFIFRDGILKTTPAHAGALEGITRNSVIALAKTLDIQVQELEMSRHDIYACDECFLTGTAAEIIPVIELDKRKMGDGKVGKKTTLLIKEFKKLVLESGSNIY